MWLDKLLRAVHLNAWWAAKSFGMSAPGYCDIEGVDGEHALVTDEGGLVSLLYLGGTRKMVNATNITEVIAILSRQLSAYMSRNAHSLQVVITRDNGMLALDRELSEALNPSLLTAQRVGLEMDDLFRAKAIRLASVCAVERAYLVAFTSPDAVSPADRRAGLAERQRVAKEIPGGPDGLRPLPPITSLRESHTSLVKTLTHDLQHLGYRTRLMRIDEAMRTIRHEVDPDWTAEHWQPSYPGDGVNMGRRVRAAEAGQRMEDMSNVYWPSMARQLIPRGAEVLNTRVLQIGSRMYQPVCLSLPPSDPQTFAA